MSVPLDSDGFLRRECPTCDREFKWLPSADDGAGRGTRRRGYFCPYCAMQARLGSWLTQAQVDSHESMVPREVLGPMLKDFSKDMESIGRRSGGSSP